MFDEAFVTSICNRMEAYEDNLTRLTKENELLKLHLERSSSRRRTFSKYSDGIGKPVVLYHRRQDKARVMGKALLLKAQDEVVIVLFRTRSTHHESTDWQVLQAPSREIDTLNQQDGQNASHGIRLLVRVRRRQETLRQLLPVEKK